MPDIFLIPAKAWEMPNEMFVDRNYDKPGQKVLLNTALTYLKRIILSLKHSTLRIP